MMGGEGSLVMGCDKEGRKGVARDVMRRVWLWDVMKEEVWLWDVMKREGRCG